MKIACDFAADPLQQYADIFVWSAKTRDSPLLPLREKVAEGRMRGPRREKSMFEDWTGRNCHSGSRAEAGNDPSSPLRGPSPARGEGGKPHTSPQMKCLHTIAPIRERERSHAPLDQGPAGDLRRRRRARARRRGRHADRRARRAGRAPQAPVDATFERPPCRAAGPRQRASSFLPDADPRPSRRHQQGAVSLVDGALSDLGAAEAGAAAASPRGSRSPN